MSVFRTPSAQSRIPNPESRIPNPITLSPLNAIVDADAAARAGWNGVDLAAAYVRGGVRFLQIRAKHASGSAFLDLASRVVPLAHAADALVIVNDRADIARLAGADGVHVGTVDRVEGGRIKVAALEVGRLVCEGEREITSEVGFPYRYSKASVGLAAESPGLAIHCGCSSGV